MMRLIGALVIIVGFALLSGAVLNSSDSWRAVNDYSGCVASLSADAPDYSQLRLTYCQQSIYNITGVQMLAQPLTKSFQAQVLLTAVVKIFASIAIIFLGVWLYRPFSRMRAMHAQAHAEQRHHRK
ncbi:MAG TPA: hypothetical protein VI977_04025 [archaeon]|nr:hypothetical protein [archaeon]